MSEMPGKLNPFEHIDQNVTATGSAHLHGTDANGDKWAIKADDVLREYGYDPKTAPSDFDPIPVTPVEEAHKPVGRSTNGSGMQDMEHGVNFDYYKNLNTAADTNKKARDIEAKKTSPETSLLNDKAEFEIYGDKGRDITYTEEFIDPADGLRKTREVSSLDKPYPGKLEEIRSNRRYGKTEAERNLAADKYEEDINSLLADGFELTQAKLVMDLREADMDARGATAGKFMVEGKDPVDAKNLADAMYDKKDKQRLALIKDEGLMTADEYNAKRTGAEPITPNTAPAARTSRELSDDQKQAVARAESALKNARDRYIELAASRRKLGFGLRKDKRNSSVEDALNEYNVALEHAGNIVKGAFDTQGASEDEILAIAKVAWAKESEALNIQGLQTRQEQLANSKFMKGFNNWWTRQTAVQDDGSKARFGRLKKVAVMAAIGTGTTLVTGVALGAAGVGFGAILPAAIAWRFAKGQAVGRISKNADASTQAEIHNSAVHASTLSRIERADSLMQASVLTAESHEKTEAYVRSNKKRVIGSAVLGAIGGTVASSLLTENFDGLKGSIDDAKDWLSNKIGNLNLNNPFVADGSSSGNTTSGNGDQNILETLKDLNVDENSDRVLPGSVTGGVNPEDIVPVDNAVTQALENQTTEIMSAEGNYPWSRAADIYGGNNATPRLIEAVETLKAQGVDASWSGDMIVVNGNTDVNYVWAALAPALAEQDLENFYANAG